MFLGCCPEINVDVSNSDARINSLNGVWTVHSNHNGRPVYNRDTYFLFYVDNVGPKRWIVEKTIGKTSAYGYIRYEGDVSCPEFAGPNWSQVWDTNVVDGTISVSCGKQLYYNNVEYENIKLKWNGTIGDPMKYS